MKFPASAKTSTRLLLIALTASANLAPVRSAMGAPQLTLSVSAPTTALPDSNVVIAIDRSNTEQGLGGLAYTVNLSQTLPMVDREYSDFGWIANDGFFDNSVPVDSGAVSGSFQSFTFDTIAEGAAGAEFPPDTSGPVEWFTIQTPPAATIPPQGLTLTVNLASISASDGAGADWTSTLGGNILVPVDSNGHAATLLVVAFSDCNSNGVFDGDDIAGGTSLDCNANDRPDECEPDCDSNGTPDDCDIAAGTSADCNSNGMSDQCEIAAAHDCCEFDHGAGCQDPAIESCVCTIDPYCCDVTWDRLCAMRVEDDACGSCNIALDCDSNGVPDECQSDFDTDGVADTCDSDIDGDGVPNAADPCLSPLGSLTNAAGGPLGDFNNDCAVTLADYPVFEVCLTAGGPTGSPPSICLDTTDFDQDGDVDLADVASLQAVIVVLP